MSWIDQVSDWNPQLFRELKGRLKPRIVIAALLVSVLAQAVVLLAFWGRVPTIDTGYSPYCTGGGGTPGAMVCVNAVGKRLGNLPPLMSEAERAALGSPLIDWSHWWADIFVALSWGMIFVLLLAGVYMLISDVAREERRGTLNFIRLSPQTSGKILMGKLLGVPVVPYLAVALAVPLQLTAAIAAGMSVAMILSWYLIAIATGALFYTASLLFAFLGGSQGWVGAVIVCLSYSFFFQIFYAFRGLDDQLYLAPPRYFDLPVAESLFLTLVFWLTTLSVSTYWFWQAANRRFRNPNLTLLSKQQSYLSTLCLEVWLLGFVSHNEQSYRLLGELLGVSFINVMWFILLIAALSPQRQMLLDWARYRREQGPAVKKRWSHSLLRNLIWGEKSPALVAIALNLVLATSVFTPWVLTWQDASQKFQAGALIALGMVLMLTCAVIAQCMLFLKTPKRAGWAAAMVGGFIVLPPSILAALSIYPSSVAAPLWLFTIFAFGSIDKVSAMDILFGFLVQISIFSALTLRLTSQLRKAGDSESKALLVAGRLKAES